MAITSYLSFANVGRHGGRPWLLTKALFSALPGVAEMPLTRFQKKFLRRVSRKKSPAVMSYITMVVHQTAEQVANGGLSAQQMLNIAQAAARMKVTPREMQKLVDNIEDRVSTGGLQLNHLDWSQWSEVQQWCPPARFYAAGMGFQAAVIPVWGY